MRVWEFGWFVVDLVGVELYGGYGEGFSVCWVVRYVEVKRCVGVVFWWILFMCEVVRWWFLYFLVVDFLLWGWFCLDDCCYFCCYLDFGMENWRLCGRCLRMEVWDCLKVIMMMWCVFVFVMRCECWSCCCRFGKNSDDMCVGLG